LQSYLKSGSIAMNIFPWTHSRLTFSVLCYRMTC
jgi:hypothetical protein